MNAPTVEALYDAATFTLTYVVYDPQTKDAVVIDPVLDYDPLASQTDLRSVQRVLDFVKAHALRVHAILETHAHADHLSGAQLLKRELGADVVIGSKITVVQETFAHIFDLDMPLDGSQFDRLLDDGETLEAGSLGVKALATPGHTPACSSYLVGDAVFTGDALFMDDYGTGRCDFPRGSADELYTSLTRLYALPDATRVFVGHDYQPGGREVKWETTIGASKRNNPQMKAETTRDEFVSMRQARDATLRPPRLLYQSVQVNANGGRLPAAHDNGIRYLRLPINAFAPSDDVGARAPVAEEEKAAE